MKPKLPPPDPHESLGPPKGPPLPHPVAVFLMGPASPETDRLADAVLDLRPGALFVTQR
jgi:hypothetical protein